jgi:hypothetical protein
MRSIQFLVASAAVLLGVDAFSIPDTLHLVQTAATTVAHQSHAQEWLIAYKQQLAAHPVPTKMLTGATLAVAGDAVAQSSNPESYDVRRATSFATFDSAYRALQHVTYPALVSHLHGQFLGGLAMALLVGQNAQDQIHSAAAMEQTLASQLIIVPFLYYPAFFILTAAINGLGPHAAWNRAQENFIPLMKRNLLFWIPVQFIQFGFIPTDLQIPFLSCAGLAWTCILSIYAGSVKSYSEQEQEEQVLAVSILQNDKELAKETVTVSSSRARQLVEA